MLTLHHAPRSRSSRIVWLLEEVGEPYEIVKTDIARQDGSGAPDPRNPHPDKRVPALVHDGALVTESAAICLYLSDAFPKAKLGPVVGDPQRGAYLTWLFWYPAVVEPAVIAKASGATEKDPAQARLYADLCNRLAKALEKGPYLLGDRFSTADILIASVFQWGPHLLPKSPAYDAFMKRIGERPALQRAMQKDG